MIGIVAFLTSTVGRVLVIGGGIIALWVAFASHYRNQGRAYERGQMQEATDNATSKGKRAADGSRSDGVRGKIDPSYRD